MVDHQTLLTGAAFTGSLRGPAILRRTDREFIPAILNGLKSSQGRADLASTLVSTRDEDNVLKLFQPVHQVLHVALVQAFCDVFGYPRLDANKIDGCGLVIRRIKKDNSGVMERWSKSGDQVVGWVPCTDDDVDPDPTRRRPRVTSGNPEIDKRLVLPVPAYNGFSEDVTTLFPAPPDVCDAAKATILYGLIPVTSTEKSETAAPPQFDSNFFRDRLPYFLDPTKSRTILTANATLTKDSPAEGATANQLIADVNCLKQLQFEYDAFGDSPESKAFFQLLNQLSVNDADGHKLAAFGDFLKNAADILVGQDSGSITMPAQWPDIDNAAGAAIAAAAQTSFETHLAGLLSPETRYEDTSRQYRMRAFARVKRPDGCPPELIWTEYTEPFKIAAWYESSGLPPVKIPLPLIDRKFLKSLKPNVAFSMPEDLFNQMQRDPKKAVAGDDTSPGGLTLGLMWLCSFNIPIITICAFIVLNIFLSLFNLFFSWLLFIKICIPIPVPTPKKSS
jgi:hypothetical protein